MKMKQFICAIVAIASLQGLADAQNATTVTNGEKGKFFILTGATGVRGGYLSPDAMFMGGTAGNSYTSDVGYIYDIARDTLKVTTAVNVIKTWDIYAGNGRIFRNGQEIRIETRYPDTTSLEHKYASVYAASAGMDTIVTMSHEWTEDPFGENPKGFYPNYPYLVDGHTGKILRRIEPHWGPSAMYSNLGFGARVNVVSNDATVLVGHSKRPGGSQFAPVFWDLKADTSYFVGTESNDYGSLSCVNNDGTLIGGTARGNGVLIHYDRENKTYTIEDLPTLPGKKAVLVTSISETGLVLYVQASSSQDVNSRESYVYNMNDGSSVKLEDYVRELYGLEMPIQSFTAFGISDDGRKITGWSFSGGMDVPYLITLDDSHIFAKPRQLNAKQTYGEMSVRISWAAPLLSQYTLKGYDVYCDGEKLNAERLNPVETSFEHAGAPSGVHNYTVKAVYEEGESDFCTPIRLLVIAGDGCLPVQEIGHHLTYNRGVEVYWGLPSARMAQAAVASAGVSAASLPVAVVSGGKAAGRDMPAVGHAKAEAEQEPVVYDMISYADLGSRKYSSVLRVDDRLYVSQYDRNVIFTMNPDDMSVISQVEIAGVTSISNMEYLDGNLYLGTAREEIVVVDVETMTVSNRIQTKANVKVRHVSYIPTLNGGKGGFAYGDWDSMLYCDRYGRELTENVPAIDVKDLLISGTAYYNGKLYLYSQTGTPQLADLYTVDVESGRYVGKQNMGDIQRLANVSAYGFIAGGITVNTLPDGTKALALMLQYEMKNSHLAWLEVERQPNLAGFNLYRSKDGAAPVRVNPEGEYLQGLSYREDLTEAGTYVYTVEAVSKNGCTNRLDDVKTSVVIEPIGECAPVKQLTAYESAKAVHLDWGYEKATTGPGLVGFNIYRDDELLTEHLVDLKYTEFNVDKGDYTYRVEAFYDNSCTASQEAKVTVTHEGTSMPPAHLSLTSAATAGQPQHYDVEARWELPYFEQPFALGYCNMPYNGTGLQDGAPLYALVAWDSARLEPYRDLYVVGIEYFIGQGIVSVEGLVYMNDTLAYQSPKAPRVNENAWNTLMFDRYFSMDQPMEFLVGYKVTYSDRTKPVAIFDAGPGDAGYSDLLSNDGQQWTTLAKSGIKANWCINALVVDKRDIEEVAAASAAGKPSVRPVVNRMSLNAALALTEPQAVSVNAAKSSSESVRLQGFNIYRENEKLNETLLKTFSYTDLAVPEGSYEYEAEAVYADGSTQRVSKIIDLGDVANLPETLAESVKVFPNPARLYFRVEGDYTALAITDLSGKTLRRYTDGRSEIDATGLKAGLYVLRFTLPDGTQRLQKIVLE